MLRILTNSSSSKQRDIQTHSRQLTSPKIKMGKTQTKISRFLHKINKVLLNNLSLSLFYHSKKIEFGGIKGSMSRRLHPIESNKINFNLTTGDVAGAWHGTHSEQFLRREVNDAYNQELFN